MKRRIWITWEAQRRSIELARQLACRLFIIEYDGILRYPKCILRTLVILVRLNPNLLFVQNPSMILATLACIYKLITRTPLIVDRHTTFLLSRTYKNTPKIIIFKLLHRFTIRFADLTLVTNEFLADLVKKLKGIPFILPDKIPQLNNTKKFRLKGKKNLLLISSFGADEPIEESIDAMKSFKDENVYLYITGNYRKLSNKIYSSSHANIVFTGFLDEQDFINMLFSVDAIIVLTKSDYVMLCGCYEAVSAGQPLVTSNKSVLKKYFKGAIFVDNSARDISNGISNVTKNMDYYKKRIQTLKQTLTAQWEKRYGNLEEFLYTLK